MNSPELVLQGMPLLTFVAELRSGENNFSSVYKDSGGIRYVVRRKKEFSSTGPLLQERNMLLFLEHEGIDFAPRSVFFHDEQELHIISFVAGEDVRPFGFDDRLADLFSAQLARLHGISRASYEKWCAEKGVLPLPSETLEENLQTWFVRPAKTVEIQCPDPRLAAWAVQAVAGCVEQAKGRHGHPPTLVHGDLGGNMMRDEGSLVFIDWERARFLHLNELGYIFVHGECPAHTRTRILSGYADALGLDRKARQRLGDQVAFEVRLLEVDKVLWRANKYTELAKAGAAEAEKYRAAAYEALQNLERPS